jgi:hypothetical protein
MKQKALTNYEYQTADAEKMLSNCALVIYDM